MWLMALQRTGTTKDFRRNLWLIPGTDTVMYWWAQLLPASSSNGWKPQATAFKRRTGQDEPNAWVALELGCCCITSFKKEYLLMTSPMLLDNWARYHMVSETYSTTVRPCLILLAEHPKGNWTVLRRPERNAQSAGVMAAALATCIPALQSSVKGTCDSAVWGLLHNRKKGVKLSTWIWISSRVEWPKHMNRA